ncbi:gamma-glutamyltransferase family protein [Alicyclobacillus ferrooxydans]|nr:gamma-glutamyltransferase family protein [Alicyclobacillus ferrooxydans]
MNFDAWNYPYASRRTVVYANRGMVATGHPLAAQAGLSVLAQGGNAIDAAVATAAALTVVEPTANGIGADAFALVWVKGKLHGLNSSGPSAAGISIEAVKEAGHSEMPTFGWTPVTVPGAPAAWAELVAKFGKLPLTKVLAPAIELAEEGHAVAPTVARGWQASAKRFAEMFHGEEYQGWFDTFAQDGKGPNPGDVVRLRDHARTLQAIAETDARAFYEGELAERIDAHARKHGGYLRLSDLASFHPEWVDPISVNYRGYDVWEIPPNGQGIVALMALNIISGYDFTDRETYQTYHRQIEAIKLAFADGKHYVTDPRSMRVSSKDLLSAEFAAERRKLITDTALLPEPGKLPSSGTVYLATADGEGNMVSFIQSNYMGFGSGIVVPGTGIGLQNRGHTFSLDPNHVNALAPGKKTYHTIIPGFLTKGTEAVGPFGVMGGFMQPQGHLQVVSNMLDFHMNPQAALDAPRWQWMDGKHVVLERGVPAHIAEQLARMGHQIQIANEGGSFGRGQIIVRMPNGSLAGGTEPRTDGHIAAW